MKAKSRGGFTLMEAVIALALWLLLSSGVLMVWQFSTVAGVGLMERQSAFENARLAMDALKMNFQLARRFELRTDENDILRRLVLNQRDPQGNWHDYRFDFNIDRPPGSVRFQRLEFGGNEFASGIAEIRIIYVGNRVDITVISGCEEPIVLEGSVCVRFKEVTVIGGSLPNTH